MSGCTVCIDDGGGEFDPKPVISAAMSAKMLLMHPDLLVVVLAQLMI